METIQERTFQLRNQAMDALVGLIHDVKAARAAESATLARQGQILLRDPAFKPQLPGQPPP